MFNPEMDEATATQLCVMINNHIEALRVWERKLRTPFLPTNNKVSYIHRITPVYPLPTLATGLHVVHAFSHTALDMTKAIESFAKAAKMKEES
jgi:hypothetical protein